jgi:Glycosyl transferase family 90
VFWGIFYRPSTWLAQVSNFIERARRVAAFLRYPELATYQALPQSRAIRRTVQPDTPLLDVQIEGKCGSRIYKSDKLNMEKQATYKYVVHVEGNGFWADRVALQLFGTSAVLKQITPCGMFFEPLLEAYKHYIPVDYFFRDVVRQVHWARAHDLEMRKIVREAREFAGAFLSSAGIQTYVEELLSQYSALMPHRDIVVHPSAIKLHPIG